jgi:(S)-ureidoglycine aminohydrolase
MKILNTLLFVLTFGSAIAQDQLKSGVYNLADLDFDAKEAIYFSGPSAAFTSFTVTAIKFNKQTVSFGKAQQEELIIIKEGTLQVTLGNKRKTVGPGSIIHIMPGTSRGFEVVGGRAFVYSLKFTSVSPDTERGESNGGSFIIDWNDVEKKKSEKGWHRQFYNRPTTMVNKFEMHVTTLSAGISSHAPHTHPEEEIVILLKGKASMEIDGKKSDVLPGGLIYLASGVSHAITNTGKEECEYFAFQWKL